MTAPSIRLGHVNIRTADIERTCAFYETVLGFRRVIAATNPNPAENVWLCDDAGNPSLHVNTWRAGETPAAMSALHHVAFNCPDRDAMTLRLESAGIAFTVMETPVPGLVQYNIHDPNGVRVELTFGADLVRFPAVSG